LPRARAAVLLRHCGHTMHGIGDLSSPLYLKV